LFGGGGGVGGGVGGGGGGGGWVGVSIRKLERKKHFVHFDPTAKHGFTRKMKSTQKIKCRPEDNQILA